MKLQLSLKKQWFDLTASGVKTEDYREINEYWCKRLLLYQGKKLSAEIPISYIKEICKDLNECTGIDDFDEGSDIDWTIDNWYLSFKKFTSNKMTLGYPSKTDFARIKEYEHLGIEIGYGKQEWGAEPNKLYFIIKHGKEIKR